ncbi:MAG TPA: hypothetical protein VK601_11840, partial [Kofleriaceae bacterium]|nr:hypothetical protein [Kofleriaceae bacterium]
MFIVIAGGPAFPPAAGPPALEGGVVRNARLGLGFIIIVAICGLLGIATRAALAAPLRTSATAKGLFIGAAVNMTPFRNEPIYTETLRR